MKFFAFSALVASTQAINTDRVYETYQHYDFGNSWPAPILPSSEPILPIPSAPILLQQNMESTQEAHIRHKLQHKLRKALKREHYSPIEENLVFLGDDDDTVEGARLKAAQMQAQLDKAVADADAKRAEQQKQFEMQDSNDPAAQLQGLMNAQASLHRLTSAFSAKPNLDKVTAMAQKLGIPMTPELMQLGSNEAISNALVEIAVGMGKSEDEIGKALGSD